MTLRASDGPGGASTPSQRLRDATLDDLDELLALETACYPPNQGYSRAEYRYALGPARAVNLALEEGARIIGFAGAFHHKRWRTGHIFTVNVDPAQRGRALGVLLMEACHERLAALGMRRVVLEVNVENASAIKLYEKLGYTLVQRLPDYYTQYANNDAFLYERALLAPAEGAR